MNKIYAIEFVNYERSISAIDQYNKWLKKAQKESKKIKVLHQTQTKDKSETRLIITYSSTKEVHLSDEERSI